MYIVRGEEKASTEKEKPADDFKNCTNPYQHLY